MSVADTPAMDICRWVPSPGSKRIPSPSQLRKYPLWFRVRVGTWLLVPSTTSSRISLPLRLRRKSSGGSHPHPCDVARRTRALRGLYSCRMAADSSFALVLGGGGVTGVAWETGIVAGLAAAGVDLTRADLVVGTSAGAVVGAQLTSGMAVEDLYQRQLKPATGEIAAHFGVATMLRYA